jgi:anti-sigma B factor antagonist
VNGYQVARDGASIYVRVSGLANMKNAPVLDVFLSGESYEPSGIICVDLGYCTGMDSTFMGLLVGTASRARQRGSRMVIVNPSETCAKLIEMLGVSEVVPVVRRCQAPALEFIELANGGPGIGTMQRMEMIRRAHVALSGVNQENHVKFAAFLAALDADLAKLR